MHFSLGKEGAPPGCHFKCILFGLERGFGMHFLLEVHTRRALSGKKYALFLDLRTNFLIWKMNALISRVGGKNERNSPFFPLIRGVPPGSYRKGLRQDKILKSIPFAWNGAGGMLFWKKAANWGVKLEKVCFLLEPTYKYLILQDVASWGAGHVSANSSGAGLVVL